MTIRTRTQRAVDFALELLVILPVLTFLAALYVLVLALVGAWLLTSLTGRGYLPDLISWLTQQWPPW